MLQVVEHACPNCGADEMALFYKVEDVPVHSVLLFRTREEARNYQTGTIALGYCRQCGFIANLAFDPSLHEYSQNYEETQGFSATFNAFHQRLAKHLVNRYDLHDKDLIEIGCGKGEFLALLCELGNNRGVGFDPAYVPGREQGESNNQIEFVRDFYSEEYADYQGDFICCKMTLEHIQDSAEFVGMVRRSIGDRPETTVFFQVPETKRILSDLAFWDIYYEHCSYFSPVSFARLFRGAGFDVIDLWTDYDDQYLMIEARPGNGKLQATLPEESDLDELGAQVSNFAANYLGLLEIWRRKVRQVREDGRRIVLWGGGSKAVAFLTTLGFGLEDIEYAVDINPFRAGTFLGGAGQEIVSPTFLRSYDPDVVIVMNPIYLQEIRDELNKMGLSPKVLSV